VFSVSGQSSQAVRRGGVHTGLQVDHSCVGRRWRHRGRQRRMLRYVTFIVGIILKEENWWGGGSEWGLKLKTDFHSKMSACRHELPPPNFSGKILSQILRLTWVYTVPPLDGRIDWVVDAHPGVSSKNVENDRRSALWPRYALGYRRSTNSWRSLGGVEHSRVPHTVSVVGIAKQRVCQPTSEAWYQCFRPKAGDSMATRVWYQNVGACSSRNWPWCSSCGHEVSGLIWLSLPCWQIDTQLIFHTSASPHPIYLDLTAIGRGLGQEVRSALCHAFSGYNSTSTFSGRGKVSRFKLIKEGMNHSKAVKHYDRHWTGVCRQEVLLQEKRTSLHWSMQVHIKFEVSSSSSFFEILRFKRIRITSLTFQGHVTSSFTWPFDSPYTISY